MELVDRAVPEKTDVIVLPEGMTVAGTGKGDADVSEPVPGPTTEKLGELARRKHAYIVGGIYESYGRAWVSQPTLAQEKTFVHEKQWNDMVIDAHGGHVIVRVNGIKSAELKNDKGRAEGHFALQMHAQTVMHVMFKDIEILEGDNHASEK